jgi:hypothetical protein
VALAEFNYYSNANRRGTKDELWLRCAIVKKVKNEKVSVIVTTAPWEAIPSGENLARWYYDRWPCQELKFKEMGKHCNLNVNHGFKKRAVFNRLAAKRFEQAEKSLAYNLRRLENVKEKVSHVNRQIAKRTLSMEKKRERLESQIAGIEERLKSHNGDESKLMIRLVKKNEELDQLRLGYHEKMGAYKEKLKSYGRLELKIVKLIALKKKAVSRWKNALEETVFYEIETEMDHIMSNFKVLIENMYLYVQEYFFAGGPPYGLDLLIRTFVDHYGDLEIIEDNHAGLTYRFILNGFDTHRDRKTAQHACDRMNAMNIRTLDGINIEMRVKRR